MFTAYHAIMFAIVLVGGVGVIFKASSGEKSPSTKAITVKGSELNFDLNTY